MTNALPWRSIAPDVLVHRNEVYRRRAPIGFEWLGQARELTLMPCSGPRAGLRELAFDWGGARAVLRAEAAWFDAVAGSAVGCETIPATPPLLMRAVLEAAFADISQRVEAATARSVRLDGIDDGPADLGGLEGIAWQLDAEGERRAGELWLDPAGLAQLAEALAPMDGPPADTDAFDALPVPVRFTIGWTALTRGELAGAAPGDVVLLDECWLRPNGRVAVRVGRRAFGCVLKDTTLEVTDGWRKLMDEELDLDRDDAEHEDVDDDELDDDDDDFDGASHDDGDGDDAPTGGGDGRSLDDVPVRLSFELGERTVTLAELRAIAPGHTFDLGREPRRAVDIRANGMTVGQGELVNVDGRVGVSILNLKTSVSSSRR